MFNVLINICVMQLKCIEGYTGYGLQVKSSGRENKATILNQYCVFYEKCASVSFNFVTKFPLEQAVIFTMQMFQ